ncbi:MAG: DUF1549 and DUF1553 domain-containing protein [Planctomycetia bacterium]|nr:DUF1549 and DUF1553 domain-containing protein [Planctomycetia bacterium]
MRTPPIHLCRALSCFLASLLVLLVCTTRNIGRADEAAKTELPLNDSDREHWAYVPPVRPALPEVKNVAWCRTPIDRFILAKLEAARLTPAPPAAAAALLRRVTFDLTGLPPTPQEIEEFTGAIEARSASAIDAAYLAVIDRLLASDAYAERQAQHWLDLARYADTDGYEHDNVRPDAWRYRDWVIDAFRRNLPLDEFIRLQIAGDELRPDDSGAAVATGFLLCGPDMPDLNRQDERRSMLLNELTGTVSATLLGLQLGCAQCHDHKYEPLSQADFYRLRACFETASFLSKQLKEEDDAKDDGKPDVRRMFRETPGPWPASRMLLRGDFQSPGPAVDPGFPRVANPMQVSLTTESKPIDSRRMEGSGRRTALARWLTRSDHPLTSRVLINRIWQQHFVEGLVRTPSDFGYLGDEPSHAELLDWLATELVARKWNLKEMHRLLVTSSVYRQAGAKSAAKDQGNRLLSHYPRRRLDGEELRDAMLAISGRLNRQGGGPGVMPPLPKELLSAIRKDHWKTSPNEADHRRRSIYLFVRRNLRLPMLDAFDRPDTIASCPKRNHSTTAPQALVLLNSEFALQAAADSAAKLQEDAPREVQRQIETLYLACLGRRPSDAEVVDAQALVASNGAGLADLCLALFNLNEFAYVD